jgi:two-component system, NarL family, nitrate/nitrite response regulator NarL
VTGLRHPSRSVAVRVVIADDQRLALEALKGILEPVTGINVVGVTHEAKRIVGLVRELQPDLLLLDYAMPDMSAWTLLSSMRRLHTDVAVVLITGSDDPSLERQALMRGARGFVHKSATPEQLIVVLRTAVGTHPPVVTAANRRHPSEEFGLTAREQEILAALIRGLSRREIAGELRITRATVQTHMHNLYEKLGVHSRLEAVRLMLEGTLFGSPYNRL